MLAAVSTEQGASAPPILYVGGQGGVEERLVARAGLPFAAVPAGGVHGVGPWRAARNTLKLLRGWWAAYRLGRRERPAALFVTGGYASVPVALAAWMLRVPILVYLPDIEPGLAVRFAACLARRVAVTVPESRRFFRGRKVIVTGYPVRAEFGSLERAACRAALGLAPEDSLLVVIGGSTGARGINRALCGLLEEVLRLVRVVHLCGERDWGWVAERAEALPAPLGARYRVAPYMHAEELGPVLAAADLALCRAGAMTLGELPFFGLPAILVPYPYAWRYQQINSDWLVGHGAAVRLDEERLGDELVPTLRALLGDRQRLGTMAGQMRALARPDAARRLAAELWALAG
jgi:UDP-N-acetylglucosamine--N-acetylmuramyl-(pentapeptide) pyrophosphoryl-undecaprenol N-acetylglucosamine transferase